MMHHHFKGALTVALAFVLWGLFPAYWKMLEAVPAMTILWHRVIWAFIFFSLIITLQRRWQEVHQIIHHPRNLGTMILTSLLIMTNWLVFIWAVNSGQIVEASLGYFMNPIVNVLLGVVILRERLLRWQFIAVLLAGVGVSILTVQYGRIPWIAFTLAISFGFYGFIRKTARAESLVGMTIETAILSPAAVLFLWILPMGSSSPNTILPMGSLALLVGGGVVTAIPLLLYNYGTRSIPFSTAGFLQYIAPSLQLLLGVVVYRESFTLIHLISFGFIWTALFLYTLSGISAARSTRHQ